MNWIKTSAKLPEDGELVETKIDDDQGERNIAKLRRRGNLWFMKDDKMYVYYTPTHWRPLYR